MNKNQNGFITMIVILLVIAGVFIWFAIDRIIDANNSEDLGSSSLILNS